MFSCEFCDIYKNTVLTKHFRTTASTNSETCFEFQISVKKVLSEVKIKLISNLKERRELIWKFYYNYSWLFCATSIASVDFHRKNNYVLLWWFSFGMCLIHFNPMFHLGRKQFFHNIGLKWIETPYLKWRKQLSRLQCINWRNKGFCLNFPVSSHILLN